MVDNETLKRSKLRQIPFLVRVFSFGIFWTSALGAALAVMGYPIAEWPFVSGVFAVSLLVSGSLVSGVLALVCKRLNDYGRLVLAERGVDINAEDTKESVPRISRIIVGTVFFLLVVGAAWGLALTGLVFVIEFMAMPPLGTWVGLAGTVVSAVGVVGLAIGLSLYWAVCYSLRHMGRRWDPVSAYTQVVFNAIRGGEQGAVYSRAVGIPVRAVVS